MKIRAMLITFGALLSMCVVTLCLYSPSIVMIGLARFRGFNFEHSQQIEIIGISESILSSSNGGMIKRFSSTEITKMFSNPSALPKPQLLGRDNELIVFIYSLLPNVDLIILSSPGNKSILSTQKVKLENKAKSKHQTFTTIFENDDILAITMDYNKHLTE